MALCNWRHYLSLCEPSAIPSPSLPGEVVGGSSWGLRHVSVYTRLSLFVTWLPHRFLCMDWMYWFMNLTLLSECLLLLLLRKWGTASTCDLAVIHGQGCAVSVSLLLSRFSRVRLCAASKTAAYQASPSLGFSRQEHWSGLPFPSPMRGSEKWKWSHSVVS